MKYRLLFAYLIFFCINLSAKAQTANEWIRDAIVYQITPYIFTDSCHYPDIEAKIPELSKLGINTIYLQPVFKTKRGKQGYDITDYFHLREDLGTESELLTLIKKAKLFKMHVLFDMVPNHTSIHHPYALDIASNGKSSPYYNYYQHDFDNAEYSMHYHKDSLGFVYYFWKDLVNLNFNNDTVQKWMISACKYWIQKFDIDGYRFDAVWGINARTPSFSKRLTSELKKMKPDLLLIAEDKPHASTYALGYDAAYDWDTSEAWVSKWSWQYEYDKDHSHTLFSHPLIEKRKELLRKALFSDGDSIGPRLRYLENNDLHRFITNHSLHVTKMAATLLFSLDGIPMIFNGQETGFEVFPYRSVPIYERSAPIREKNPDLFDFYAKLTKMRSKHPSLTQGTMKEILVKGSPGGIGFLRSVDGEQILVLINLDSVAADFEIEYEGKNFVDLMSGKKLTFADASSRKIVTRIEGNTTRVLMKE